MLSFRPPALTSNAAPLVRIEGNALDTQTRHSLKQDKLATSARVGVDWLQDHRSEAIKLAVAVVAVIAIAAAAVAVYFQRTTAAELSFGEAMDTYSTALAQPGQPATPGEKTFPTAVDRAKAANRQFLEVANRYPMLRAGKNARYFAGLTEMDMGANAAAESDLKRVAESSDQNLAALAKFALASLYAQTARASQAVALYNQLIAKPTTAVPADAAKLQLAALYETINPAEAKRMYAQMKNGSTAAGQIAAQKLGQPNPN